jgi:hypothetical protein
MPTVDRTRFVARHRTQRLRVVQPVPRRALVGSEPGPDATTPRAAEVRTTPEDATLRALFRVAAAALARRGEPTR